MNKIEKEIEDRVINTYQKENPSTYLIESDKDEYDIRKKYMENLFIHRLNFPPKMFDGSSLLEFGSGTGEHSSFYLQWGASGTFVEADIEAYERSLKIFKHFSINKDSYDLKNQSLFDFQSDKKFDIVLSNGVIHHTNNKSRAFNHLVSNLKVGGFCILGVGNNAGLFQRNLQRSILYAFSKSEDDIVKYANLFFSEHLDRAEKYGRRSRMAIIYDTYVNPKIDTPSVSEVMQWFEENNLRLYSSWPPVSPSFRSDSYAKPDLLNYSKLHNVMSFMEINWMSNNGSDMESLSKLDDKLSPIVSKTQKISEMMNNVMPDKSINFTNLLDGVLELKDEVLKEDVFKNFYDNSVNFLNDVEKIIKCVNKKDIVMLKREIDSASYLFRGTSGLGMNQYIGYKVCK